MTRIFYHLIGWITLGLIGSCQKETTGPPASFQPSIVVEGSIEQGSFPIVYLTKNIPYYTDIDSSEFINLVIRQAKVVVSDGNNSEILTLMFDQQHFPPYYYQGTVLTGQVGITYQLQVFYGTDTLTSSATIPAPVNIDSAWLQPIEGNPQQCFVCATIHDDPLVANYYKTFTSMPATQSQFYPTLESVFNDKLFNGRVYTFELNKGPETYLNLQNFNDYFKNTDSIYLKIQTLQVTQYNFWLSYQSEIIDAGNPFAASFQSLPSNIIGNGLGIWGGYGATVRLVSNK
jgi:hypothetical protein